MISASAAGGTVLDYRILPFTAVALIAGSLVLAKRPRGRQIRKIAGAKARAAWARLVREVKKRTRPRRVLRPVSA